MITSVTSNLSMLGFFKYGNFLLANFQWLLARAGIAYAPPHLDIFLPIGISFYTFHSLSYTLDVYRRVCQPTKSLRDFTLAVSFFPQLVAGPIVRAADFLPQLVAAPVLRRGQFYWGLLLMTLGLFEKIVLADTMLADTADTIFGYGGSLQSVDAWSGVLAFAGQIFFDFSGYSTCAIGAALCLGFHLKDNFRFPYAAVGFSDFWRRWHISLSTFLRDFLYIPLGGNRSGPARAAINLMIVMFIGGLWHGAAWTFVVWGLIHGVLLVLERLRQGRRRRRLDRDVYRQAAARPAHLRRRRLRLGVLPRQGFHRGGAHRPRHDRPPAQRRGAPDHERAPAGRARDRRPAGGPLVAARHVGRGGRRADAALARDRTLDADARRHHSHPRKRQCLHLLPILNVRFRTCLGAASCWPSRC